MFRVKIGLIGSKGRLGRAIAAVQRAGVVIAEEFYRGRSPQVESQVDLFLDVSSSEALAEHLRIAREGQRPIVVGTTGKIAREELEKAASEIPVFYSANFSLKMALFSHFVKECASFFSPDATVEITETHHAQKKDAPSGSAKFLAEIIQKARGKAVPIHSIRTGAVVGEHQVLFFDGLEQIVFHHKVIDRKIFAEGAIEAALFLQDKPPGLYGMKELLIQRCTSCQIEFKSDIVDIFEY